MTKVQIEALKWFVAQARPVAMFYEHDPTRATRERLEAMGLIKRAAWPGALTYWEISQAGRDALARHSGK